MTTLQKRRLLWGLAGGAFLLAAAGACSFTPPERLKIKAKAEADVAADTPLFDVQQYFSIADIRDKLGGGDNLHVYDYREPDSDTQNFLIHYHVDPINLQVDPTSFTFIGTDDGIDEDPDDEELILEKEAFSIPLPNFSGMSTNPVTLSTNGDSSPIDITLSIPNDPDDSTHPYKLIDFSTDMGFQGTFEAVINEGYIEIRGNPANAFKSSPVPVLGIVEGENYDNPIDLTATSVSGGWRYSLAGKTLTSTSILQISGQVTISAGIADPQITITPRITTLSRLSAPAGDDLANLGDIQIDRGYSIPKTEEGDPLVTSITFGGATDDLTLDGNPITDPEDPSYNKYLLGMRFYIDKRIDGLTITPDFTAPVVINDSVTTNGENFKEGIVMLSETETLKVEDNDNDNVQISGTIALSAGGNLTLYDIDATQSEIVINIEIEPIFEWTSATLDLAAIMKMQNVGNYTSGSFPSPDADPLDLGVIDDALSNIFSNPDDIVFSGVQIYPYASLSESVTNTEGATNLVDAVLNNLELRPDYSGYGGGPLTFNSVFDEDNPGTLDRTMFAQLKEHIDGNGVLSGVTLSDYVQYRPQNIDEILNDRPNGFRFNYYIEPPSDNSKFTIQRDGGLIEQTVEPDILILIPLAVRLKETLKNEGGLPVGSGYAELQLGGGISFGGKDLFGRSGGGGAIDKVIDYAQYVNLNIDFLVNDLGLDGLSLYAYRGEPDDTSDEVHDTGIELGHAEIGQTISMTLNKAKLAYPLIPILKVKMKADKNTAPPDSTPGPNDYNYGTLIVKHPVSVSGKDRWGVQARVQAHIKADIDYDISLGGN
ncbi:MAG: hypothetical protein LBR16_07085 [Treponema sp.]|jgi:hypothetical protein|nr:hypothetical protein [Treponema sp.]